MALVLIYFPQTKGLKFFLLEGIVVSFFFHRMVLISKVYINHLLKHLFVVLLIGYKHIVRWNQI